MQRIKESNSEGPESHSKSKEEQSGEIERQQEGSGINPLQNRAREPLEGTMLLLITIPIANIY